jgi:uncharacterized protein YkwD
MRRTSRDGPTIARHATRRHEREPERNQPRCVGTFPPFLDGYVDGAKMNGFHSLCESGTGRLLRPCSRGAMAFTAACALLLAAGASRAQVSEETPGERLEAPADAGREEDSLDFDSAARGVVKRTNAFRAEHDRETLAIDDQLMAAAVDFAQYMAKHDKYGHGADGQRPAERAAQHGYEYCIIAENIAYRFRSSGYTQDALAEQFVQGWIDSAGHRENMLKKAVTQIGVGVARSESTGYYYGVQMFGRPRSARVEFSLQNRSDKTLAYRIGDRQYSLAPRYRRTHMECRPPELTVWEKQTADGENIGDAPESAKTLEPQPGVLYVARSHDGRLTITDESQGTSKRQ